MDDNETISILFHEFTHLIIALYAVKEKDINGEDIGIKMSLEDEEHIAESVAAHGIKKILDVIKNNTHS